MLLLLKGVVQNTMLFRQIEYFQAIIEIGNFYQAAEKCKCFPVSDFPTDKNWNRSFGVKLLTDIMDLFTDTGGRHFTKVFLASDIEQIKRKTKDRR